MELEFDKEIDAMLRKAHSGGDAAVGTAAHLDADTIAAFAENALPQQTKLLYMEHFADCGRCRKQLSQAITMNSEADAAAASTVSAVSVPEAVGMIPWYEKVLKTQILALAMGALLLVFTGSLGYLLLQGGMGDAAISVSQVSDQEPNRGGPFFGGDDEAANTNAAAVPYESESANVALQAANSNAAIDLKDREADKAANRSEPSLGRSTTGAEESASGADTMSSAMSEAMPSAPKAVAPPPPFPVDGASGTENTFIIDGQERREAKETELSKKRKQSDDSLRSRRDAPPAASKSGPARAGPLQNQSNQTNTFEMPVTRNAGGKKFNNRDGAWYDTAYRGQATINLRRGSDAFNKLDGGLRDIANTIGGTVVIVWKGKAYRIQ